MAVRPTARTFVVCDEVTPDPSAPGRLTLVRVAQAFRPDPGATYPVYNRQLCGFAQLTGGRGAGAVRLVVRRADTDAPLCGSHSVPVDFGGNDPLAVRGVVLRLRAVRFPAPGLYWVELWYDSEVLAQAPVLLRPEHPSP